MDISQFYTTRSGKNYRIRFGYNERIGERDTADKFVKALEIINLDTKEPVQLPVDLARFSTFENFTSFGSYSAINYQGVRDVAITGLRTKLMTRIEDALERLD